MRTLIGYKRHESSTASMDGEHKKQCLLCLASISVYIRIRVGGVANNQIPLCLQLSWRGSVQLFCLPLKFKETSLAQKENNILICLPDSGNIFIKLPQYYALLFLFKEMAKWGMRLSSSNKFQALSACSWVLSVEKCIGPINLRILKD